MKCWSGRLLMTLLVLLAVGGAARADMITPWTYIWTRSPISVASDGNGTGGTDGIRGTVASTGFGNGTANPPPSGGGAP